MLIFYLYFFNHLVYKVIPLTNYIIVLKRESVPKIKTFLSKKSKHLANNVKHRRIMSSVDALSQNGYISFPNFIRSLNHLKITEIWGNDQAEKNLKELYLIEDEEMTDHGKINNK
jgi:hypothetical protein